MYAYTCIRARIEILINRASTLRTDDHASRSLQKSARRRRTVSPVFSETFLRVKCNYALPPVFNAGHGSWPSR